MINSLVLAVAVVAHDPGYYTSLANHVQRWLSEEKISSRVVTPREMGTALANERLAFLVGFASPTKAEMQTLRAFRARGGKLVVFHSASPALGELMGVKPVGYRVAAYPGEWSRMDFSAKVPEGLPSSIMQTSSVLQRARPADASGRVVATWSDRRGKSTGEPAWIATRAGFWMTHVLTADGDEEMKARLLGAIAGAADPKLWNLRSHLARRDALHGRRRAVALAQTPRKGEIHAVWDHSGCGLYPGDWPRTMKVLAQSRVTDVFVNVAGAGFAHYPSAVLPRSKTFVQEGDQLAAAVAAGRGAGIRVHAWMLCFSATRASPETMASFAKKGWRLRNAKGVLSEYLDPSNEAVRRHVLAAIAEMQEKYAISGVHLDFVRWGDGLPKPKDAALPVSRFVSEARRTVKRPKWLTAAVYGKYPNCISSVGQDWIGWIDSGTVDYAVPMDYCESAQSFETLLSGHASAKGRARRVIVGIGVTANESRLDAIKVMEQINIVRKYGFAGESLFDLDMTLEKSILPYLRLGIW